MQTMITQSSETKTGLQQYRLPQTQAMPTQSSETKVGLQQYITSNANHFDCCLSGYTVLHCISSLFLVMYVWTAMTSLVWRGLMAAVVVGITRRGLGGGGGNCKNMFEQKQQKCIISSALLGLNNNWYIHKLHMQRHMSTHTHTHTHTHTRTCTRRTNIHMYISVHTHTRVYTHTLTSKWNKSMNSKREGPCHFIRSTPLQQFRDRLSSQQHTLGQPS